MELSPRRSSLYRNHLLTVIWPAVSLAVALSLASSLLAQGPITQYGRKPAVDKGPRALGLVQLSPKGGKGRLIPIAIMMDGKFYDAGSYKASPVPMALDFDTVYEGLRTGVSQGVFTITQPGQLNHVWIAEGTWLPAGMKAPEKSKKYSTPVIEDKDAPPVLHRHSESASSNSASDTKDKGKDKEQKKDESKPVPPDTAKTPAPSESAKAAAPPPDEPIADPNRPRLRRGKPDSTAHRELYTTFDDTTDAKPDTAAAGSAKPDAKATASTPASARITFAAISDEGGPEPRPYTYEMKPAEEASYRSRMLDLAATLLHAKAGAGTKESAPARKKSSPGKPSTKSAGPALDDVSLRVFDLSSSNEPILVLSARTHPASAPATGSIEEPQEITLIARTNLEGELQKLFFSQTDSRHLYAAPRMELVDAVDADGDGRGELLFRRTSDNGSAYSIYRVTADGLWPLFEGTP